MIAFMLDTLIHGNEFFMISKDDFMVLLRTKIAEHGSAKAFAHAHGLSQSYVHLILKGAYPPSEAVAAALGYRRDFCFYPLQTPNTTEETASND